MSNPVLCRRGMKEEIRHAMDTPMCTPIYVHTHPRAHTYAQASVMKMPASAARSRRYRTLRPITAGSLKLGNLKVTVNTTSNSYITDLFVPQFPYL